jgi:flavodoxin
MRLLIVYFSLTGNNRLLAEHLGRELGARVVGVVETHQRSGLTILLDMLFKRRPAIRDLGVAPQDYDHVLLLAPLWNMNIAHPMTSAILQMKAALGRFSFVSFCGYQRPGQAAHVAQELERLTGRAPARVWELHVGDLFPPEQRNKVRAVSAHRVSEKELASFQTTIGEIAAALR